MKLPVTHLLHHLKNHRRTIRVRPAFTRILISFAIVVLFSSHLSGICHFSFIDRIENFLYDVRLKLTMPNTKDPRIIIVDIDEKSLAAEGRWPWGRDRLAVLVDNLFDYYQIDVLGFDVVFAESDESSGLKLLNDLAKERFKDDNRFIRHLDAIRPSLERDLLFAKSLSSRDIILSYYFQPPWQIQNNMAIGKLPEPVLSLKESQLNQLPIVSSNGYIANLSVLQSSTAGGGYFDNPIVDADGVFRRIPMVQEYQGNLYESFSLAMVRRVLGSPPLDLVIAKENGEASLMGLEWLTIGGLRIPVDEQAAVLVPYRGKQGSFPYVSAVDILTRQADPQLLRGGIVLVGSTTPGLKDLRSTPIQNVYPGIEIHANLISGILDQAIKHKPGYVLGIEFLELVFTGLLMSLLLPRLSPFWSIFSTSIILLSTVWANVYLWVNANLVVALSTLLLMIVVLFVFHMSFGFIIEAYGKKQIARLFEQYVPPELVDEMSKNLSDFGMDGESREMTVLFSDIRDFTTLSENMDPRQLTQLMNEIFTPMTQIIYKHRGTIDKYMGDAIMAFWGAPLPDANHAQHALQAAFEMTGMVPGLQERFKKQGWPAIDMGIGLNTGIMNVGNMGSEFRITYTVIGDAVNLGSRLGGLTKEYGAPIIVSGFTKDKIQGVVFQEIDHVRVKGKVAPVTIYSPLGYIGAVSDAALEEKYKFHKALTNYRHQNWDMAERQFIELQEAFPHSILYTTFINRIHHFRISPPGKEWDGVFTFQTK